MPSLLDNDVDHRIPTAQYPVSEFVTAYLEQSGNKFVRLGATRREQAESRAQDLWDYLGDFA